MKVLMTVIRIVIMTISMIRLISLSLFLTHTLSLPDTHYLSLSLSDSNGRQNIRNYIKPMMFVRRIL
jgi:hypothetical protein